MQRRSRASTLRSRGFTLIELMIVVVVIAILGAIAYPSYTSHTRKAKRAEAKTRLLQIAQLEERYFTENNGYTTNIAGLLGVTGTVYSSDTNSSNSGYQVTAAASTTTFTLSAVPQGGQTNDTACMTLKLLHTGQKQITGSGTVSECWN